MEIEEQIHAYFRKLDEVKSKEMLELHQCILAIAPNCKRWFLDGKDSSGKVVANANVGYGEHSIHYANGTVKPFYKLGISANSVGISMYIFGLRNKHWLKNNFGETLGKAAISNYCIKFKSLKHIQQSVLEEIIKQVFLDVPVEK